MIALWTAAALAAPVVSAMGGYDNPTAQPWAGVDIALHASNTKGIAPVARLAPGWGFGERSPMVFTEIGLMARLPEDEAVLRGGLIARPVFWWSAGRTPIGLGDPTEGAALGIVPGLMAAIEFEFNADAPLVVGARGGLGSTVSDYACDIDAPDPATCLTWYPGFIGGLTVRKHWASGLTLDLMAGPTAHLALGYSF